LNRREQAAGIQDAGSQTLYEIDRGMAFGRIRFSVSTWRGRERLDIREYYQDEASGEWLPTRKGISLPRDFLPELLEGVEALRKALQVPA
jgi:hypothetical protein